MAPILECQRVSRFFGGLCALEGVDLKVNRGDILGVIGPNGAGKTTLFNVISGALKPSAGDVFFNGKKITGYGANRICRWGIARTYQLVRPFASMTALENVLVGVSFGREPLLPFKQRLDHAVKELEFVGLKGKEDKASGDLTLVDKKRLEIARALATEPEVLLLDEVVSGLTPGEVGNVIETIGEIQRRGITVIMIEHVLRVVMALCPSVMVLHYGSKIAHGSPEEVVNDIAVVEAYLGASSFHQGGARASD